MAYQPLLVAEFCLVASRDCGLRQHKQDCVKASLVALSSIIQSTEPLERDSPVEMQHCVIGKMRQSLFEDAKRVPVSPFFFAQQCTQDI
jgi:hypothetical protein